VQTLLVLAIAPVTPHVAVWFPPAYALLASLHTIMIFAARRFTGVRWGATLAAAITAVMSGPFTAIGWLIAVPLVTAGALFDVISGLAERHRWGRRRDVLVAGAVVGFGLFAVSLPVMSPDHLAPAMVIATLAARVLASWAGALLSAVLVDRLERVGVRRARGAASRPPAADAAVKDGVDTSASAR
jgi:hypothetical protein